MVQCREKEYQKLQGYIKEVSYSLPSSIFLYGFGGTGKSLVITRLLVSSGVQSATASCLENYSMRIIYESILNQFSGFVPCKKSSYSSRSTCDNFGDFVGHLKEILGKEEKRYAIVLERAERLREGDINIFPALCRLNEFCDGVNICVVFTSHLPLDKFRCPMGFLEPLIVHFPQYTKDELIKIIVSTKPDCGLTDDGYKNYVTIILSVFYMATRNLPELKSLALLNLTFYLAPIKSGQATEDDLRILWRNIEPRLSKALSTVYLREVSSDQFIEIQSLIDAGESVQASKISSVVKMELPFYSKFLLVAAYLASFNPVRSDKRFFTKNHGKQKKSAASMKAQMKSSGHTVGPKPFPLDRMMAIFYAIIEDKVAPTASIFSQITTLVSLRLLVPVGHDVLDTPKFKSNVTLSRIRSIARTVNFEVMDYLYDFSK